jgi:hypothetical protein
VQLLIPFARGLFHRAINFTHPVRVAAVLKSLGLFHIDLLRKSTIEKGGLEIYLASLALAKTQEASDKTDGLLT